MSKGRSLPHSLEAEEYLLSCCLLDGADVVARCLERKLDGEAFYEPKHGIIFDAILALYNNQKPIDVAVLAEELKLAKKLDLVGGYAFLAQVSSRVPTTAQAEYFISAVRTHALLRKINRAATAISESCYSFSGDIEEFVDSAEVKLFAVTQQRVSDVVKPIKPSSDVAMGLIKQMAERRGALTGISSGFIDLDRLLWGFQKKDMIILAARPSCGKTALALNFAEYAAMPKDPKAKGSPVLIFSLEMGGSQLAMRMICSRARVNMSLLRDGLTSKHNDDQKRLDDAKAEIDKSPIFIDDSSSPTANEIRAKARRLHSRTPLGLIVVDYLQLIAPSDKSVNREQQVSEASRSLKALAKELDVPVLVLSQLNRASEKEQRAPRLSDLRESGSIEQDADVVLMLSRPKDAGDDFQTAADTAELTVAKQRNGPVGDLKLTFLRDITRFENFHR